GTVQPLATSASSPRTAPYHTEASSSTVTSPTSVAVGATKARGCTWGAFPSSSKTCMPTSPCEQSSERRTGESAGVPSSDPQRGLEEVSSGPRTTCPRTFLSSTELSALPGTSRRGCRTEGARFATTSG